MLENWDDIESDLIKQMKVWLHGLTKIGKPASDNQVGHSPKVLFLLDNDYGELTTILYLILGQDCFWESKILLTPRLHEHNQNILPGRIEKWSNEQELLQFIDAYQPDVLVLAAGYLLPVHNLLTSEALERVCRFASEKQIKIVTADPFLGLISQWSPAGLQHIISIDIPVDASNQLAAIKRIADAKLHKELAAANAVLRDYPHLYPTYTDMIGINTESSDSKNRSFFNKQLLIPDVLQLNHSEAQPHWVFIISEVDFQTQSMHLGTARFVSIVSNLLLQGTHLGRKMIFLGPSILIELLRSRKAINNENIHLFNFGAFERVMALLLTAEYSFYWNVVSHTILIQLWNGKPVVLFDKGHLARAIPSMYDRIIAWYYQGWEPQYFDHNETLSLATLAEFKNQYCKRRLELMKSYQRAPSPETLLNSLIDPEKNP